MLKQYLLVSIFILSFVNLNAQIDKEISSFVDSTELIINNGRRLLMQSIEDEDVDKARQVYDYLVEVSVKEQCSAFTFIEELYINTLFSDWERWIGLVANDEKERPDYCFQLNQNIGQILFNRLRENIDLLLYNTEYLTTEDRQVLDIYFYYIRNGVVDEVYNQKIKMLKKEFPNSKYNYFLNYIMPKPKIKGSTSISLGSNFLILTNNLAQSFTPELNFAMSVDFNINKVYSSLYMVGGEFQLQKQFGAVVDGNIMSFEKGEYFNYLEAGLIGGYFLVRNQRFHISPFGLLSGTTLKSDVFESDEEKEDNEFKAINSFTCGVGLHIELKLKEWGVNNFYYYGDQETNYISLKLDIGYNVITQAEDNMFKGNVIYFRPTLVWGFGDF